MPAEVVGGWAKDKHELLCRYIDISRGVRSQFLGLGKAGATYIDLFCGPGMAQVKRSGEWIDGSCVAAWKKSVEGGSPFSTVYIGDADDQRREYAATRLRRLGAPVVEVPGRAVAAVDLVCRQVSAYGLHFAFLDPYNLAAFDFEVVRRLSALRRIDMLVHVSKMDLQRNLGINVAAQQSAFDKFAPGWRETVNVHQLQPAVRREVLEHWRGLVEATGLWPSVEMKLITGGKGQHLYWLTLAARHELAHKFWKAASRGEQFQLF